MWLQIQSGFNRILLLGSSLCAQCEFGGDKPVGDHQCSESWGEHAGNGDRL